MTDVRLVVPLDGGSTLRKKIGRALEMTDVRLVHHPVDGAMEKGLGMTDVRLAGLTKIIGRNPQKHYGFEKPEQLKLDQERKDMTKVQLGYNPGPINAYDGLSESNKMTDVKMAFGNSPPERKGTSGLEVDRLLEPALLVSFWYLKPFLKAYHRYAFRDWALDSGAFSAFKSGVVIDLEEFIDTCHELLEKDKRLVEIFSLDAIGGPDAKLSIKQAVIESKKNYKRMCDAGLSPIPVYHVGEPVEWLEEMAAECKKIAIGGMAGRGPTKTRLDYIGQCFARTWPKRIHGFGLVAEDILMKFPFHSVDATNWEMGPCAFGSWKTLGKASVRGSDQNLRGEVEWYLKLERKLQARWRKEMEQLSKLDDYDEKISIRLCAGSKPGPRDIARRETAFKKPSGKIRKIKKVKK